MFFNFVNRRETDESAMDFSQFSWKIEANLKELSNESGFVKENLFPEDYPGDSMNLKRTAIGKHPFRAV